MRLMIDTNIFLDVLAEYINIMKKINFLKGMLVVAKTPSSSGRKFLTNLQTCLCENKRVQGFLSASSATDIFYLIRRQLHSVDLAYKALGSVLDIAKVLTVTNEDVLNAYLQRASDFEDCLLATCAKANQCDAIVTRNKKDFLSFGITLFSPEELLNIYP